MNIRISRLLLFSLLCSVLFYFFFPSQPSRVFDLVLNSIGLMNNEAKEKALSASMDFLESTRIKRNIDIAFPLSLLSRKRPLNATDKQMLLTLSKQPHLLESQQYQIVMLLSEYFFLAREFEFLADYLWSYIISKPNISNEKMQIILLNFKLIEKLTKRQKELATFLVRNNIQTKPETAPSTVPDLASENITSIRRIVQLPIIKTVQADPQDNDKNW